MCLRKGVRRRQAPSTAGRIVERIWFERPQRLPPLVLDAHVVMPNHPHAILPLVGAQ